MGFWQIPPSSSQEYLGSKWIVETGAYPKTWQLVPEQSYYLLWKKSLAPKHSDKSWNFKKKMLEPICTKICKYFTLLELTDGIGFPRPPMSPRLCPKQHRLCWPWNRSEFSSWRIKQNVQDSTSKISYLTLYAYRYKPPHTLKAPNL